jgi:hypothetical protein
MLGRGWEFGHLQDYGTSQPVLTDVYYVLSQTNQETKQVTHSLVKRGKELHEPDRMYLNPAKSYLWSRLVQTQRLPN